MPRKQGLRVRLQSAYDQIDLESRALFNRENQFDVGYRVGLFQPARALHYVLKDGRKKNVELIESVKGRCFAAVLQEQKEYERYIVLNALGKEVEALDYYRGQAEGAKAAYQQIIEAIGE
jgi:hypothetical protein